MEYLNFKEIGGQVAFKDLLNWLNIPYKEKNGELKGELRGQVFVINIEKNMYFLTEEKRGGSIINFLSDLKEVDLRTAALEIKKQFIDTFTPKREIPELKLEYCKFLEKLGISESICKVYEVGMVHQKSIMSGKIAFKVYENKEHIGYIGFNPEKKEWFYPKNFTKPLWNYDNVVDIPMAIVTTDPFEALKIIEAGLPNVVSLLSSNMSEKQEVLLSNFKQILLIHNEPENIVNRLYKKCFIKAVDKPIDYTVEKVLALL